MAGPAGVIYSDNMTSRLKRVSSKAHLPHSVAQLWINHEGSRSPAIPASRSFSPSAAAPRGGETRAHHPDNQVLQSDMVLPGQMSGRSCSSFGGWRCHSHSRRSRCPAAWGEIAACSPRRSSVLGRSHSPLDRTRAFSSSASSRARRRLRDAPRAAARADSSAPGFSSDHHLDARADVGWIGDCFGIRGPARSGK